MATAARNQYLSARRDHVSRIAAHSQRLAASQSQGQPESDPWPSTFLNCNVRGPESGTLLIGTHSHESIRVDSRLLVLYI